MMAAASKRIVGNMNQFKVSPGCCKYKTLKQTHFISRTWAGAATPSSCSLIG